MDMSRSRMFFATILFVLLVHGPGSIVYAKEPKIIQTLETKAGEVVFAKLPGNPSAGYKWQINKELSKGLNLVKVDQIGWLIAPKGKSIFFQAQSVMNVAIHAKAAGKADLAFDYYRELAGETYTTTSIVRVVIKSGLATQ